MTVLPDIKGADVGHHPDVILAGGAHQRRHGPYIATEVMADGAQGSNRLDARGAGAGLAFKENCPDLRNTRWSTSSPPCRLPRRSDVHDPWVDAAEAQHEYAITPIAEVKRGAYDAVASLSDTGNSQNLVSPASARSASGIGGLRRQIRIATRCVRRPAVMNHSWKCVHEHHHLCTGYVGLVTGTCLAEVGHDVMCIDIDRSKVEGLDNGVIPIYEPGLAPMVKANHAAGRLRFSTDAGAGIDHADVLFIAVGTPQDEDGSADLTHVLEVAGTIGDHLLRPALVVNKSTVPVGTADRVHATIASRLSVRGVEVAFDVVSNPEFLKKAR